MGNIDIILTILDLLDAATLVLLEGAEGQGVVRIRVRAGAGPCWIVHLRARSRAVSTASILDLGRVVKALSVIATEAEVISSFDALAALQIGIVHNALGRYGDSQVEAAENTD